jgi:hypothetical protein
MKSLQRTGCWISHWPDARACDLINDLTDLTNCRRIGGLANALTLVEISVVFWTASGCEQMSVAIAVAVCRTEIVVGWTHEVGTLAVA